MDTNAGTLHPPIRTGHVDVPGAQIYYELRGAGPLVVLHAAPMTAASWAPLANLLATDHTVLTADPRGISHSTVTDPDRDVSPDERAADLARVLEHIDRGPATLLGSSGGAVSALALTQSRPDLVHTVVAHEPPLAELLPDRDELMRAHQQMRTTYLAGDRMGYWRQFLNVANIAMPPDVIEMVFGGPRSEQDAADERYAVEHMDIPTTFWKPELATLRNSGTTIIVGIGEESTEQLCDRSSRALAAALRVDPMMFPGGHIGFVEQPEPFAARLREIL